YSRYIPQVAEGPVSTAPFGPNWAVRRAALGADRFDERLGPSSGRYIMGDETELLIRLQRRGNRFIYLPNAGVEHVIEPHQLELPWLLERAERLGRSLPWVQGEWQGAMLLSAPRYLWRNLMRAWAGYGRDCWRGRKRRWV